MRQQVFQVAEQEVDIQRAFVRLVDDQYLILAQAAVVAGFGKQDAVGHELEYSRFCGAVVEADLIADAGSRFAAQFLRDAAGHRRGRDPARLGAADPSAPPVAECECDLGKLGGLAAAGVAADDDHRAGFPRLFNLIDVAGNRQFFGKFDPEAVATGRVIGIFGARTHFRCLSRRNTHQSYAISSPSPA